MLRRKYRLVSFGIGALLAASILWRLPSFAVDGKDYDQFFQMISTTEACEPLIGEICQVRSSRYMESIRIGFFHASDGANTQTVHEHVEEVVKILRERAKIDILLTNEKPNLVLVLADDETLKEVRKLDHPLLDDTYLNRLNSQTLSVGACEARIFVDQKSGPFDEILSAIVFVSEQKSDHGYRKCVAEEIVNSLGLLNDPLGHASLFDHPDHAVFEHEYLNETTIGFLEYLYSAEQVSRPSWNLFWEGKRHAIFRKITRL
ncbi:DUF2927 domain-containing protein [uncultured Roseobacter sp.]|uniref:DUF2927 domain-containing protein n=1 Tax=uncultured Roseobacter sp. TaxID=114847 RepID=UPI00261DCDB3|nr:DUF2927 domain-containing protein [uncultured Roseobacter sp.]